MCGGTQYFPARLRTYPGPSPRVRGNRPAPARGRRRTAPPRSPSRRGHPRVCGGTWWRRTGRVQQRGPSPRVRGNRGRGRGDRHRRGAIPACAGEPSMSRQPLRICRGHPRVCGGTGERHKDAIDRAGPSPRVRGNLRLALDEVHISGAIPACAGEPDRRHRAAGKATGHPRVCGGTAWPLGLVAV